MQKPRGPDNTQQNEENLDMQKPRPHGSPLCKVTEGCAVGPGVVNIRENEHFHNDYAGILDIIQAITLIV